MTWKYFLHYWPTVTGGTSETGNRYFLCHINQKYLNIMVELSGIWDALTNRGPSQYKMSFYQWRDSHYKDKAVSWPLSGNRHSWRDRLYIETTPGDDTVMRQRGADASMMTSSNGNSFCVTGSLCGDFTGHRWIHRIKAGDAELWCFLRSAPEENGWVNKREAGHLKRHRALYDVIVMEHCGSG